MVARKKVFLPQIKSLALVITKITGLGLSLIRAQGRSASLPAHPTLENKASPFLVFPNDYPKHNGQERPGGRQGRGEASQQVSLEAASERLAGPEPAVFQRGGFTDLTRMTHEKAAAVAGANLPKAFLANELEGPRGSGGKNESPGKCGKGSPSMNFPFLIRLDGLVRIILFGENMANVFFSSSSG